MYNMNTSISIGSKKITFRLEILILILIVSWILWGHLLCSCSKINMSEGLSMISTFVNNAREGFQSNNIAYTPQYSNYKSKNLINKVPDWFLPNLTYGKNRPPNKAIKEIWDRKKQPIPLPKGELDMFATTPFKPECCPNAYSNSTGCACMTVDQYNYLIDRGGNNVPYSEY